MDLCRQRGRGHHLCCRAVLLPFSFHPTTFPTRFLCKILLARDVNSCRYTPFFKMYRPYVAGYEGALNKLQQVQADRSSTAVFFGECAQRLGSQAPKLDALLIEPVQRIPRYRLLLEEARKQTPAQMHADCDALDNAVKAIQEVAKHINDMAREDDERQKVIEIHSRFKPPKDDDYQAHGALAALVQPRRRFVQCVCL